MSFKSRVASVNYYPKGSTVGYDRTYKLTRDSYLANLPFGYSDAIAVPLPIKGTYLSMGIKYRRWAKSQ
ncbi:alanine racemase [Psychrobacter sp. JCM 18901]|nr:alanine racemase [Psychrobacter sp. JCM 18901]